MANGFDAGKITRQLRSPRNLLEFADISIQPRQSTTAEVIANTLDDAFERASQTYLQGKQLDAQIQQQQIQSDLRREQLDIEQKRYQKNEDKATDNVIAGFIKDESIMTELGRESIEKMISTINDPRLQSLYNQKYGSAKITANHISKYENVLSGKEIEEMASGTYTVNGVEKSGLELINEYSSIADSGSAFFNLEKNKVLESRISKYLANQEYYNFAYGKYEDPNGEIIDKLDRLGMDEDKKIQFRALNPAQGMTFLREHLSNRGLTLAQSSQVERLEKRINGINNTISKNNQTMALESQKPELVTSLTNDNEIYRNRIKELEKDIDKIMGYKPIKKGKKEISKSEIVSNNINSFKNLNTTEKQSFLQNHPQLSQIKTIINDYTSQDKSLSLTNPEFLDSLSKIGVFDDTIKTTQGFPSISNQPENLVQEVIEDDSPVLADVARPSIPVPTSTEQFQPTDVDVPSFNATFDDVPEFPEPNYATPKNIEDNPNEYIANNPVTASGTVSKDINKFLKETERLQKFRDEGQSQSVINNQDKKVKELQSKIKNKFFGYISSETGNFSNQNYTDKFYNSLSSKTKQSPQRLKTLMQIIASSR
tara:strand:- start:296 stop:2089 length:1794 start_codon:yes stop_codon:yes gene_type:complete